MSLGFREQLSENGPTNGCADDEISDPIWLNPSPQTGCRHRSKPMDYGAELLALIVDVWLDGDPSVYTTGYNDVNFDTESSCPVDQGACIITDDPICEGDNGSSFFGASAHPLIPLRSNVIVVPQRKWPLYPRSSDMVRSFPLDENVPNGSLLKRPLHALRLEMSETSPVKSKEKIGVPSEFELNQDLKSSNDGQTKQKKRGTRLLVEEDGIDVRSDEIIEYLLQVCGQIPHKVLSPKHSLPFEDSPWNNEPVSSRLDKFQARKNVRRFFADHAAGPDRKLEPGWALDFLNGVGRNFPCLAPELIRYTPAVEPLLTPLPEVQMVEDLEAERSEVKKSLKDYDELFYSTFGVNISKAEKEPMRPVYRYYEELKSRIKKQGSTSSSPQCEPEFDSAQRSNFSVQTTKVNYTRLGKSTNIGAPAELSSSTLSDEVLTETAVQKLDNEIEQTFSTITRKQCWRTNGPPMTQLAGRAGPDKIKRYSGLSVSSASELDQSGNSERLKASDTYVLPESSCMSGTGAIHTTATNDCRVAVQAKVHLQTRETVSDQREEIEREGKTELICSSLRTGSSNLTLQPDRPTNNVENIAAKLAKLEQKRAVLRRILATYQKEFIEAYGRRVKVLRDIAPVDREYKRYTKVKEKIARITKSMEECHVLENAN